MKLHEVPVACYAVECVTCHECLAIPIDQTEQERSDMVDAHRQLCTVDAYLEEG